MPDGSLWRGLWDGTERTGFEPVEGVIPPHRFSKPALSAAQPPLQSLLGKVVEIVFELSLTPAMPEVNSTPAAVQSKTAKPYPDFPPFPARDKALGKKLRGRLHYFGPWSRPRRFAVFASSPAS